MNQPSRPRSPPPGRAAFRAFQTVTTRWGDNDVFGHVNNVTYYAFFDTAVAGWLMARGLIGLRDGMMWVVAETGCRYLHEVAFPDRITVGLCVTALGTSSVRYGLAVFRNDEDKASAEGHFVHVHVGRGDHRPLPLPEAARAAFAALLV